MAGMYRAEHPNPQWERETWRNLNGAWDFEFDFSNSAVERKLWEKETWDKEIIVPFCPESELSGIGYTDFINGVAYRKRVTLSEEEAASTVMLNFGAVDYETQVYVNGKLVGSHKGGYTPFSFDISEYVTAGENTIFVAAKDDIRSGLQPGGKQSQRSESWGCFYTRTTGIWQTVWMEFLPKAHLVSAKYYPDQANASITITGAVKGAAKMTITALWDGKVVGSKELMAETGTFAATVELSEVHLWEAGVGGLYDLILTYGDDKVKSYFGMRTAKFEGRKFMLNGKSVFQRCVLDQGYYPDGIYTAPSDEALVRDIEISYAAGFNSARLHEKVFEPRFLYHCDRLGYLVWGEYPNWDLKHMNPLATEIYLNEWSEAVERDFNHPAIIGWCPFNETWGYWEEKNDNALISSIYKLTKRLDPTRPCIDSSGNFRVISEVYDIHDYDQNPESFKRRYMEFAAHADENGGKIEAGDPFFTLPHIMRKINGAPFFNQPYNNQPIFISEFGGTVFPDEEVKKSVKNGGGHGDVKTPEEYFALYKGLADALMDNKDVFGFCFTQLYDTEQEINGFYTYGRQPKFDINIVKEINSRKAAIED